MRDIAWSEGTWTHQPVSVADGGNDLVVEAAEVAKLAVASQR